MSKRETRKALRYFVEIGLLEVVVPHRDPLKAEYRMTDREGYERALKELWLDA